MDDFYQLQKMTDVLIGKDLREAIDEKVAEISSRRRFQSYQYSTMLAEIIYWVVYIIVKDKRFTKKKEKDTAEAVQGSLM